MGVIYDRVQHILTNYSIIIIVLGILKLIRWIQSYNNRELFSCCNKTYYLHVYCYFPIIVVSFVISTINRLL